MRINILITHIQGNKNNVADYLSRLYFVPDAKNIDVDSPGPKSAQHISSPFNHLEVLNKTEIFDAFEAITVTPCSQPDLCHLNVNNMLFRGLGPYLHTYLHLFGWHSKS